MADGVETKKITEEEEIALMKGVLERLRDGYLEQPAHLREAYIKAMGTAAISAVIGICGQEFAIGYLNGAVQQAIAGEGFTVDATH